MSLQIFLMMLLVVSIFTSLFTEGIKVLFTEWGINYCANTLAGVVSLVLSVLVGCFYVVMTDCMLNAKMAVFLIALVLLSWLCAMVGYDKVKQAIEQATTFK